MDVAWLTRRSTNGQDQGPMDDESSKGTGETGRQQLSKDPRVR